MAPPQSRSSRNGSAKPAPPTRKNTFQKMLELEKKHKIERMRASAPDIEIPYRTSFSSPMRTPTFPSATPVNSQRRQSIKQAQQTGSITGPAYQPSYNPEFPQTSPNFQHNRYWSDLSSHSNSTSIDSYLLPDQPGVRMSQQRGTSQSQEKSPRSHSLSAFDPRLFAQTSTKDNSTINPATHNMPGTTAREPLAGEKHVRYEMGANGRSSSSTSIYTSARSFSKETKSAGMDEPSSSGSLTNSLSAFKILPASMTSRASRERSFHLGPSQFDGASDSKPTRYRQDITSAQPDRKSSSTQAPSAAVAPAPATVASAPVVVSPVVASPIIAAPTALATRPQVTTPLPEQGTSPTPRTPPKQTDGLLRTQSRRSSICRSPSWSATNGSGKKRREEEKRARKKAAKEAEEIRKAELARKEKAVKEAEDLRKAELAKKEKAAKDADDLRKAELAKKEKDAKAARDRQEKDARAIKEWEEKNAKEAKTAREKQEKVEKTMREKAEKEREKENKVANKQQKKISKMPPGPKKLSKSDRSSSMPIVPSSLSRLTSSSRLNSFQSTDSAIDSLRTSFQSKPALAIPDEGFIGGLKLERARKAALHQQLEPEERENQAVVNPVVAGRRLVLEGSDNEKDDSDFEKDMVRNAYHLAIHGSPPPQLPAVEIFKRPTTRRSTVGEVPLSETSTDIADYLEKPKSPFYQMSQANNSFVDEIFHTIQNKHSESNSPTLARPLHTNPSIEIKRSENHQGVKQKERIIPAPTPEKRAQVHKEPSYDASSFAVRMAKKSGELEKISSNTKVQQDHAMNSSESRPRYDLLSPPGANNPGENLRAGRLAAAVGEDSVAVTVQSGHKRQVTVLEAVKTKSHSMLIEHLTVGDADHGEDQSHPEEQPDPTETKLDDTKDRGSRSSSRDSLWFRRRSKEEPKLSIQDRRRSSTNSTLTTSSTEISTKEIGQKADRPMFGRKNSLSPKINSFKAAAKAAFSKYGPAAPSSKANLPSSPLNIRPGSSDGRAIASPVAPESRRQTLPSAVTMPSLAKADKVLGENLSTIPTTDRRASSAEQFPVSKSSSVTTKGSDEEVSSPEDVEDTSNFTTPTASRPSSKKGHNLTLKSATLLPGGRFREEFSPDFISALDRGKFETSPVEDRNNIAQRPAREISSIVPTPVASPIQTKRSSLPTPITVKLEEEEEGGLIAEAIARVEGFVLFSPNQKQEEMTIERKGQENASTGVNSAPSQTNKASARSLDITRQPSIKSASTSNLPDLRNPPSNNQNQNPAPEIDFSFLPALKHESLTRPPRASASPSLQAIAASLLGPPSAKTSGRNGSTLATVPSPTIPEKGNMSSPNSEPITTGFPFPELGKKNIGKQVSDRLPLSTTSPKSPSPRHSSLPPQNRRLQEPTDSPSHQSSNSLTNSIKASWLAAISNQVPKPPNSRPTSFTEDDRESLPSNQIMTRKSFGVNETAKGTNFQLTSNLIKHPTGASLEDPYAKCFLICCGCRRFHDLPSKVYETLLKNCNDNEKEDRSSSAGGSVGSGGSGASEGRLVTSHLKVACPWCEHAMTTGCCEHWAVCVKLVERLS